MHFWCPSAPRRSRRSLWPEACPWPSLSPKGQRPVPIPPAPAARHQEVIHAAADMKGRAPTRLANCPTATGQAQEGHVSALESREHDAADHAPARPGRTGLQHRPATVVRPRRCRGSRYQGPLGQHDACGSAAVPEFSVISGRWSLTLMAVGRGGDRWCPNQIPAKWRSWSKPGAAILLRARFTASCAHANRFIESSRPRQRVAAMGLLGGLPTTARAPRSSRRRRSLAC